MSRPSYLLAIFLAIFNYLNNAGNNGTQSGSALAHLAEEDALAGAG